MKKQLIMAGALVVLAGWAMGCKSTYDAKRISAGNVQREGRIVFVRPHRNYPLQSLRRRLEITHEAASRNAAGLLVVQVGCRNKGGIDLPLSVKTAFYNQPFGAPGNQTSVPIYETPIRTFNILRGMTEEYTVTCPKKGAVDYQVTISEIVH